LWGRVYHVKKITEGVGQLRSKRKGGHEGGKEGGRGVRGGKKGPAVRGEDFCRTPALWTFMRGGGRGWRKIEGKGEIGKSKRGEGLLNYSKKKKPNPG